MRIQFTGPEEAPFAGKEFPATSLDDAGLDDIAAMQRATGFKMKRLIKEAKKVETFGLQMLVFFTLRNAGHKVSWATASSMKMSDFETIEEPGGQEDRQEGEGGGANPYEGGDGFAPPRRRQGPARPEEDDYPPVAYEPWIERSIDERAALISYHFRGLAPQAIRTMRFRDWIAFATASDEITVALEAAAAKSNT